MLTDDDEGSDTDVEEASDEDAEEKEEEDSDGDPDEALAKQYQQEVEDESSTEDEEDDIDPEKKKIAKEKVNPYILSPILLIFLKQNLFSQTQMAVFFNKPINDDTFLILLKCLLIPQLIFTEKGHGCHNWSAPQRAPISKRNRRQTGIQTAREACSQEAQEPLQEHEGWPRKTQEGNMAS